MLKHLISIPSFHAKWSFIYSRIEILPPKCQRWLCSCKTDTGSNFVLDQQGVPTSQVTKRQKRKRSACQPILDCFDQQYSHELGNVWTSARSVLLDPHSWQYGVMLNRFATLTDVERALQSQGFSSLLPQTDASAFARSAHAVVCPSTLQVENTLLPLPRSTSKWPPKSDDPHLHRDPTAQPVCGDTQPEPLSSSHLPPPRLQCYIHPSALRFPSQAHWPGQLKQYYLLNAASLLPVLALQVRDGEKVLDLCSAPGGKALAIMQAATPELLCCNEPDPHRRDWLAKTLESFLPQSLSNRVIVSNRDGRSFGQDEARTYDKVLVDAPCSNDRSWLYSPSGQQGEQRLKERARLPSLQAQLLRSALEAVRPGGVVVYSTCTLSSSENHAVVEAVLHACPEAEPETLWEELVIPLSEHFAFSPAPRPDNRTPGQTAGSHTPPRRSQRASYRHRKHGVLVVPQPGKTWGPMFLCRIRRTR